MHQHLEGLCPRCGSPAILVLSGSKQGRLCESCNAGWHIIGSNHYNYDPFNNNKSDQQTKIEANNDNNTNMQ